MTKPRSHPGAFSRPTPTPQPHSDRLPSHCAGIPSTEARKHLRLPRRIPFNRSVPAVRLFAALHSSLQTPSVTPSICCSRFGPDQGRLLRWDNEITQRQKLEEAGPERKMGGRHEFARHQGKWASVEAALGRGDCARCAFFRNRRAQPRRERQRRWLVIAAVCIYLIAYRFYALFIAEKVLGIDPTRQTPAYRHNDGLDYVPTNRYVLFGHHFAAIAGAGPLVGPVLAAQMGYLPGTLWILAGVVFAGAVQDMTVLFLSTRRDGRSLGEMVRSEMGPVAGGIALVGVLLIMVILLAVLALVVVKALVGSPWGTFTVFCTIPIAMLMGVYARFIRIGRIAEMSVIGVVLLLASLIYGRTVAENPAIATWFDLSGETLALIIIGYGFVASVLPVWLLLAPRDYLSTFLKVGTMALLAVGILLVQPDLKMPAVTKFIDGTGPVWSGSLFPFLFITIACGAVSGFHALIASGTTPKMVENRTSSASSAM